MPSELTYDFHTTTNQEIFYRDHTSSAQHGLQPHDRSALPPLHSGESAGTQRSEVADDVDVKAARFFGGADDEQETAGLNRLLTPPHGRITKYENTLSSLTRQSDVEPRFGVVQGIQEIDDACSPISKLPNEVLIHAVSHLSPTDLAAVSLVSHRFHGLVTTPHAWRIAFARYFPGSESLVTMLDSPSISENAENIRSGRRLFARLTALASWRSEYILRTRLLRSLNRGKPTMASAASGGSRTSHSQSVVPMIMYNSQLFTTVNHMHANFGHGLNKRVPRFIHGAAEIGVASSSDPLTGKIDSWGLSDPHTFFQFTDAYPGDAQWGMGAGNIVGCPNVMDVSQPYGMIYGEGHPNATLYFRGADEMRGRFLSLPSSESVLDLGIPSIPAREECICSVWLAKSPAIPSLSDGLVGIMCGSSAGVVSTYSLGTDGLRGQRLSRGELTARWVLSPGVPIIAIAADEAYSLKRQVQNRIWAVALNALGELFFLTKFPKRPASVSKNGRNASLNEEALERLAWATGRTAYWTLVESSRRTARVDPYNHSEVDGSYSPRSSWDGMCLSTAQIRAETMEIEEFLKMKPKDFHKSCTSWDMRRRIEVDFAGDDGCYAGESIIVFQCGLEEDGVTRIERFTRCRVAERNGSSLSSKSPSELPTPPPELHSLFGGASPIPGRTQHRGRRSSQLSTDSSPERANLVEEWRRSELSLNGLKSVQITTTAIDCSTFSTLTFSEDPALGFSTPSNASSPFASPQSTSSQPASASDVPGQRARFVAAGTKTGIVILWDARSPLSKSAEFANTISPVRVIYTDSPEISCLALTALYLVHGGNDGLVQAWDPLASQVQPIRTLHSRFSQRARRRLVQNQARPQGVGINLFAAGAIGLDPDATVLRGMVSLGTHLRFWSYSSSAADAYKSSKRRLRRSERGSNSGGGERFVGGRSGNLKNYIASEKYEHQREQEQRRKEAGRLAGRFGVDLLENEEDALAYAAMLSQEAFANEERKRRRQSEAGASESSVAVSSETVTPEPSVSGRAMSASPPATDEQLDADIAEAIKLSLRESGVATPLAGSNSTRPVEYAYSPATSTPGSTFDVPIRYAKARRSPPSGARSAIKEGRSPLSRAKSAESSSMERELSDLEFAMQLSLAEEQSRTEAEREEFPALKPAGGKGKGKGKGRA